jgi:hypothetical protein
MPEGIPVATQDFNDLRRMRAAKNQNLFRNVNERVEKVAESFNLDGEQLDFICECANTDCAERLHMTTGEYEAVRRVPTYFAIADGHEVPDVEKVVERASRYLVVEKIGVGGDLAEKLDPRRPENPT